MARARASRPVISEIVTLLVEHSRPKPATEWAWSTSDAPEAVHSITVLGAVTTDKSARPVARRDRLHIGDVFRDQNDRVYAYLPSNHRNGTDDIPYAAVAASGDEHTWVNDDTIAWPVEVIVRLHQEVYT